MKRSLLILSLLVGCVLSAQTPSKSVDYTIDSKIFEAKRTISVFVPESYNDENSSLKYHVAYLFDGQSQPIYSMICSVMNYHVSMDEGLPLIIVGIHTEYRQGEFVPVCENEVTEKITKADQLSLFLEKEVMPLINSKYRTSGYTIGIGHSLGGTFVMNEIVKKESLFQSVIAISPNLLPCNEQICQNAEKYFQSTPGNQRFVYATAGTVGEMENSFRECLLRMDSLVIQKGSKHFDWHCTVMNGESHSSNLVASFSKGYLELSSIFMLSEDEMLRMCDDHTTSIRNHILNFYTRASQISGVEQPIPLKSLEIFSAVLSFQNKFREEMEVCSLGLEILATLELPEDQKESTFSWFADGLSRSEFNMYIVQAQDYVTAGNYSQASEAYKKAFAMNLMLLTHYARIESVPVFAMAGEKEEAFKQLTMLADTFELNGSDQFTNDPRCDSLKIDKRWKKLMNKLSTNKGIKVEYLY